MWFFLSLSFALITSVTILLAKKVMSRTDEYFYVWISSLFTLPFLFLIIVYFYRIPKFDYIFIWATFVATLINVVAGIAAYRAIKISEVSLVSPLSALNPIFTTIISWISLGERFGHKAIIGIIVICIGTYTLQISKLNKNPLEPLKSLFSSEGIRLSILAYFLWAITPIFQKISIFHTYPQVPAFASLSGLLGMVVIFTFFIFRRLSNVWSFTKKNFITLLLIGLLTGVGQTAAFAAFKLAPLGFATAIFKLSALFTVILGWLFFKEHEFKQRLISSLVMLAGVILLVT